MIPNPFDHIKAAAIMRRYAAEGRYLTTELSAHVLQALAAPNDEKLYPDFMVGDQLTFQVSVYRMCHFGGLIYFGGQVETSTDTALVGKHYLAACKDGGRLTDIIISGLPLQLPM